MQASLSVQVLQGTGAATCKKYLIRTVIFQLSGSFRMLAPSHGALFGSVRTLDQTDSRGEVLSGSVRTIYQTDPNIGVLSVFV